MAGARHHVAHVAAEQLRAVEGGLRRRNMVFARGEIVDRDLHFRDVELHAVDFHLALREAVLEITLAQVEGVIGLGHARGIRIPRQQIEGHRRLALDVIVHDIGPDEIGRPQHVEGVGHARAVEKAGLRHVGFHIADRRVVGEDLELAGIGEVDLRREKGRRCNPVIAERRHIGERHRHQRAADAIADGGDLPLARDRLDRFERLENAFAHVGVEALVAMASVGIDPGDDEHRQPPVDAPFDEAFLRVQIENVELVDPRRHDEKRAPVHRLCRRRVLDQLDQIVAPHYLAGRDRHVLAELELGGIGLPQAKGPMARLDVLGQHVQATDEVLAFLLHRGAQQFGIRTDEIRRRQRARDLAHVEGSLGAAERIEFLVARDHLVRPVDAERVGLPHEIEDRALAPLRIGEALVPAVVGNDRLHRLAGHAAQRIAPEVDELGREGLLRLQRARRVLQPVFRDLSQRANGVDDLVAGIVRILAGLERLHVGRHHPRAFGHHARGVLRQTFEIRDRGRDGRGFRGSLRLRRLDSLRGGRRLRRGLGHGGRQRLDHLGMRGGGGRHLGIGNVRRDDLRRCRLALARRGLLRRRRTRPPRLLARLLRTRSLGHCNLPNRNKFRAVSHGPFPTQ